MFKYTNQSMGNVKDLNQKLRQQVTMAPGDSRLQFGRKKNSQVAPLLSQKTTIPSSSSQRKRVISSISNFQGSKSSKLSVPQSGRKSSNRSKTIVTRGRKASAMNVIKNFFGSTKKALSPNFSKKNYEGIKIQEREKPKRRSLGKHNFTKQNTIKPEVTISEYEINKKWYDYEKRKGKDYSLQSSKFANKTYTTSTPTGMVQKLNLSGHKGVKSGGYGHYNSPNKYPLSGNTFDSRGGKPETPKKVPIQRIRTKLLSVRHNNNDLLNSSGMSSQRLPEEDSPNSSVAQLRNELKMHQESKSIMDQELTQLKDLNSQLIDKLQKLQEHEANNLDSHFEYEAILEGFEKICKNFSDELDPSLGNLSVRGATKKMLLNLQQF